MHDAKHRKVVRLTVVQIKTECPYHEKRASLEKSYGSAPARQQGDYLLRDCFLNSATRDHYCSDPEGNGKRCRHVVKRARTHGWRSHRVLPQTHCADCGSHGRGPLPFELVYLPLNKEGTRWYAMNVFTGERKEIEMDDLGVWPRLKLPRPTTDGGLLVSYPSDTLDHGWALDADQWYAREIAAVRRLDSLSKNNLTPLVSKKKRKKRKSK